MFLSKLIEEHNDWSEELKDSLNSTEMEQFKKHLTLFKDHFLTYNEKYHSTPVSHTGSDSLSSLDFISKWQRFEMMNSQEI